MDSVCWAEHVLSAARFVLWIRGHGGHCTALVPSRSLPRWEAEGRGGRLVIFSEKVGRCYIRFFFSPSNLQTRRFSFLTVDTHGLYYHPSGYCGCTEVICIFSSVLTFSCAHCENSGLWSNSNLFLSLLFSWILSERSCHYVIAALRCYLD